MANEQNLRPVKSKKEARERGRNGGIRSGEVKREKKLLSQMYAEFLAREHDVVISGQKQKVSGQKLVDSVISKVLAKGDSPSVSMLKELREATEGSKMALMNPDGSEILSKGIKVSYE